VLGPFEIVRDGRPLDLGGPKPRALLSRLVADLGRVVSVDRLVDDLWGEAPPPGALTSLQAYVSRLRRVLEPDAVPRERSRVLVTSAPGYRLDLPPGTVDATRFAELAARGHAALEDGRPADAAALLDDAMALWRGEAWDGFAGESFTAAEVTRLDELRTAALEDRLTAAVELGERDAVARLESAVAAHPTRERLWQLLMIALYRGGRQGDALHAYQRARSALDQLLGVDPGVGLRELESQVLTQSLAEGHLAVAQPPTVVAGPEPVSGTVVGRDAELTALRAAVARSAAGVGSTVLVAGEPGIGKTRLLRALAEEVTGPGGAVGWGGGVEGEQAPAFWPWTRALRRLLVDAAPGTLDAVRQSLAELGQLDPVFAELAGVAVPPPLADPELARVRAFRAVIRVFEHLAVEAPVLLVLDDMQWADSPSVQLLTTAAHELDSARVVLVAAFRPEEVGAALGDARAAITRLPGAEVIDLAGLTRPAVAALARTAVGRDVDDAVVTTLIERTSGNPLFVTELARLLQQEKVLDAESARRVPVPSGVRDVIARRLARLPEQSRTLLHLAAVVGRTFDVAMLEAVADVHGDDLLDRIEVAVALGVVVEAPAGVGDFSFSHDLVRDTLYSSLSGARRTRLHARVAEALEAMGVAEGRGAGGPFELARHLEAAAGVLPPARVVDGVIAAADAAVAQLDLDRAQVLMARALARLADVPVGAEHDQRELALHLRLGNLLSLTRGYAAPEVGEHFARAATLLRTAPSGPGKLHASWGVAVFTGVSGRFDEVLAMARQVLAEAAVDDHQVRCAFSQIVGTFSWHVGALDDAREHLQRAVEIQDEHGLDLRAITLHDVAVASRSFHALASWAAGRDDEADALVADARRRAEALGDPFSRIVAMFFDEWLAALRGERQRVLTLAEPVIALADEHGFTQYGPFARVLAAWAAGTPEAIEGLAAGLAGAAATGARMLGHFFLTLLGDALLQLERVDEAAEALEQAAAEAAATGEQFFAPETLRLLGCVASRRGDGEGARRHLQEARELAGRLGHLALIQRVEESLVVDVRDPATRSVRA
jgi:DNA-binding SARP family transcriptional activator